MSSKLPPFNIENLRHALVTFSRQSPDSEAISYACQVIQSQLPPAPDRDTLVQAIHNTKLFPQDSNLPQKIADSFDLMIRRDVPSFTRAKLKEKLNERHIQYDLFNYVLRNPRFRGILGSNPIHVIRTLYDYINIVLKTFDLEFKNVETKFKVDKPLFDKVKELDSELKIFSGEINEEHLDFIKNLFKLFLVGFLRLWETKSLQPLSSVQDSPDIDRKPYLDLCSGALNIKYLDQLLSADHSRQFLFLDKSQAVKVFYDTVNELTKGRFEQRVRLVTQDIFLDWSKSIPAGSVGTIRASNIFSTVYKTANNDPLKYPILAQQIFSNINQALAPGGKFIMCFRHNSESQSQPISIDEIFDPKKDYGLTMHKGLDLQSGSAYIEYILLMIIKNLANQAGYTFKVGHTDSSGQFIENKSGHCNGDSGFDTEFVMIKPKP
jgi:hypothetical protein